MHGGMGEETWMGRVASPPRQAFVTHLTSHPCACSSWGAWATTPSLYEQRDNPLGNKKYTN